LGSSRKFLTSRRIKEASRYVPLNQLCLSPQCGFSSTHEGNNVSEDDQWKKFALIIETAKEVWGDQQLPYRKIGGIKLWQK